jgi:hypothetical protein
MKAPGPTFHIKGIPSSKIKKAIKVSIKTEEKAIRRRIFSMIFSLISIVNP